MLRYGVAPSINRSSDTPKELLRRLWADLSEITLILLSFTIVASILLYNFNIFCYSGRHFWQRAWTCIFETFSSAYKTATDTVSEVLLTHAIISEIPFLGL